MSVLSIYLILQSLICIRVDPRYSSCTFDYNMVYFVTQIVSGLSPGSFSSWLPYPFNIPHCSVYCVFPSFLVLQDVLVSSCIFPLLESGISQGYLVYFVEE